MRTSRGFTLIETIVYLALFTLLIGGLVSSSYAFFESTDRNQTKAMMQEEKDFLIGKINWLLSGVRATGGVIVPASGASGSTLSVTKWDASIGNPVTLCLSGTNIKISTSTAAANCSSGVMILNNSNVTISNLVFIHTYAGGASPESIEAGFTISVKTPTGSTISQTASTTSYIRK